MVNVPRNKLIDLNNILFEQLERLNDEDLTPEELDREMQRSKAIMGVGKIIIDNAAIALEAQKHMDLYNLTKQDVPEMLQLTNRKDDAKC